MKIFLISVRTINKSVGKNANLPFPLDVQKLKGFQLQGASPPDSLTRGSASEPRWGLRPQTPAIGSCSRARHVAPLRKPSGSAPYWQTYVSLTLEQNNVLLTDVCFMDTWTSRTGCRPIYLIQLNTTSNSVLCMTWISPLFNFIFFRFILYYLFRGF